MPLADGTYYTDLGDGPPVVLIHALGLNTSMWALQLPVLAQRYRVIRYDVRGHGRTPYKGEPVTVPMLAGDLAALLNELEIERAAVVGISMGGVIAQQFAIDYPEKASSLCLVSTVSRYSPQSREALLDRARAAESEGMAPLIEPSIDRWFTPAFRARAQATPAPEGSDTEHPAGQQLIASETPESTLVDSVRRMLKYADPNGYAAACRALAQVDLTPDLEKIRAATLVLSGGQDPGVTAESQDVLARGIRDCSEVILPQSSHLIPIEAAAEFNTQLLGFLGWSDLR